MVRQRFPLKKKSWIFLPDEVPKKRKPSIAKLIQQVTRVKGGDPPTFDELTRILHAAGISDSDLAEVEKGAPWKCDDVICDFKEEVEKLQGSENMKEQLSDCKSWSEPVAHK